MITSNPRLTAACSSFWRTFITRNIPISRRYTSTITAAEAANSLLERSRGMMHTARQVLDANQLQKLCLTLNRTHVGPSTEITSSAPPERTGVSPGYHLVYFTPVGLESALGPDGTDRAFSPPAPFTRRMWAGGQMTWLPGAGLSVGDDVTEKTKLVNAVAKKSRSGDDMVLVELEKKLLVQERVAVVDRRSWIFRPPVEAVSSGAHMTVEAETPLRGPSTVKDIEVSGAYPSRELRWSNVGLFRFSALTFNGHKVHYDNPWTRSVEGHPACVVHGPLNLICILDYWRDICQEGRLGEITYRALSPLYAGDTYRISAASPIQLDDGKVWDISVEKGDVVCMKATITSKPG